MAKIDEDLVPEGMDTLLTRKQITAITGLAQSSIYWSVQNSEFPPPLQLGPRRRGWLKSEVEAWIASRKRAINPHMQTKAEKLAEASS